MVFLSVGTGIGAGIISGGHLIRGTGDIAGAVGWFALNPQRQSIYREVGCWEAEAAGPGLARRLDVPSAEEVVAAHGKVMGVRRKPLKKRQCTWEWAWPIS